MNRAQLAMTRREKTYTDVGNADIARSKYLPSMVAQHPHPTTTDGGSAGFAGAINLPCG
jgi:hypothetical protein